MPSFWEELKRRNVIRVGLLYVVAGWLLLQVGDVLFGLLDVPGWAMRLVLGLLVLGLPLVLMFAWAYEMTPEGLKREREVSRDDTITALTGRRIDRLIIAGLAAVIMVLLVDRLLIPAVPVAEDSATIDVAEAAAADTAASAKSIAVLPFVNLSGDEDNEYFSDGLTEELLNLLAKVEKLRVSSRTSSFAFKDKDMSIPSVGRELKVEHVLEGSVRKAGTQIRITAQLIDVATDSHLWSETYDRELDDIFRIQDEIASAVVDALKVRLLSGAEVQLPEQREQNTTAYLEYLRGRHVYDVGKNVRDDDFIGRAISHFERALELDPEYPLAYAGLADAYGMLSITHGLTMEEGYERSREMAQKALALDPDLVEALLALADVQLEYDWDIRGAEASYRHALAIRPSDAEGLRTYGYFLMSDGRAEEAVDYYQKALAVDPMQVRAYTGLVSALLQARRFEEIPPVIDALSTRIEPPEVDALRRSVLRWQLVAEERYLEAVALIPEDPGRISDLQDAAIIHHHLGNADLSERYVEQLVTLAEERRRFFPIVAATLVQIGQPDRAFSYLEKGLENHEVMFGAIRTDALLQPLFHDPRFLDLLERAGLEPPPAGRRAGG